MGFSVWHCHNENFTHLLMRQFVSIICFPTSPCIVCDHCLGRRWFWFLVQGHYLPWHWAKLSECRSSMAWSQRIQDFVESNIMQTITISSTKYQNDDKIVSMWTGEMKFHGWNSQNSRDILTSFFLVFNYRCIKCLRCFGIKRIQAFTFIDHILQRRELLLSLSGQPQ